MPTPRVCVRASGVTITSTPEPRRFMAEALKFNAPSSRNGCWSCPVDEAAIAELESSVNDYLTSNYGGGRRRTLLSNGVDAELGAELANLGWYALALPEAHGG